MLHKYSKCYLFYLPMTVFLKISVQLSMMRVHTKSNHYPMLYCHVVEPHLSKTRKPSSALSFNSLSIVRTYYKALAKQQYEI